MIKKEIEQLFFRQLTKNNRFTQDSPIYPDVWLEYFNKATEKGDKRADLILTPHRDSSAPELLKILSEKLTQYHNKQNTKEKPAWNLASTGESVAVNLNFSELIEVALPLTKWWQRYMWYDKDIPREDQQWLKEIAGAITYCGETTNYKRKKPPVSYAEQFNKKYKMESDYGFVRPVLWSVSKNRKAFICMEKSVPATKADASRRTFDVDGTDIVWAILDSGIDARHPAFLKKPGSKGFSEEPLGAKKDPGSNHTRILATYDFTKFRALIGSLTNKQIHLGEKLLNRKIEPDDAVFENMVTGSRDDASLSKASAKELVQEVAQDLQKGRLLDWTVISPLLRIPHNIDEYRPPGHSHGTHVAGILAASNDAKQSVTKNFIGMCPGIQLYDIRVLDENGEGDEFNILAALQFIRWFNNQKNESMIHGVNMSLSMNHEVANYACGQTPVCETCNRLVAEGTVVVAAAGNQGQTMYTSKEGATQEGFRMVNITDPGNADGVITVGATHRNRPHSYGVSYFSSKGPTGDGRIKPDLVAPGEKVESTIPGGKYDRKDGTSMAAPHVSGGAALLLAKHRELIGRPDRVKKILCDTATDLGREKYFQGCGMVDVLRAIQSV
jgi:serine protease AprX